MATLTLILDKRRSNKNGKYPLLFRIGSNRKYAYISTGIHLFTSQFNSKHSTIIGDNNLSEKIKNLEVKYLQRLNNLLADNPGLTDPIDLKNKLLEKAGDDIIITEFWKNHIESLYVMGRIGGAKVYQMSLSSLSRHYDFNIPFRKFNYKELLLLEHRLYISGVSVNGIGVYFRSLRAIYNLAINSEIVSPENYPFRNYKIKKDRTVPRVLSISEMKQFFHLNLPHDHPHFTYWNIGRLIFMLRGINITDLLLLNLKSLHQNHIIYTRSKTKKVYSVALSKEIKQVLECFESSDTLLGLINTDLLLSRRRDDHLRQKRKVINTHLKALGKELGFKEELTTYVFRYSYANIARQMGYSKDQIAEALGHEYSNSITTIYLELFDQETLDDMNSEIIKFIWNNN